MPQLFPMNWNLLILMFILILTLSFVLIYFTYQPNLNINFTKMLKLIKNWKW
uniref:ATP synthase F0 subunit 8 n=1 Tax=Alectorobius microlophi TaxID=1232731 RepID=UPI00223755D9|nr:ATP synthase F0 subunit 8 [Alectorobius microlophi]UYB78421.1 ATP synthase F0 subunit 8 [Alectorobius microlophi]UYB78434.1 ATP synthase F0 subunit 8 [Alectorobius microlophi]